MCTSVLDIEDFVGEHASTFYTCPYLLRLPTVNCCGCGRRANENHVHAAWQRHGHAGHVHHLTRLCLCLCLWHPGLDELVSDDGRARLHEVCNGEASIPRATTPHAHGMYHESNLGRAPLPDTVSTVSVAGVVVHIVMF